MTSKSGWGGARPHPVGKEGGRPRNEYPTRLAKVQADDTEWGEFLDLTPSNTRDRYEFLINSMRVATMTYAQQLVALWRQFYQTNSQKNREITLPLRIAGETIRDADRRLFNDIESLVEVVCGQLQDNLRDLSAHKYAYYPAGSTAADRETAMWDFARFFVEEIFEKHYREDTSLLAPHSKQFELLCTSCEAVTIQ